jgi:hypothetical protein
LSREVRPYKPTHSLARPLAAVIAAVAVTLALGACGGGSPNSAPGSAPDAAAGDSPSGAVPGALPGARPQAVEPTAGQQAVAITPSDPVGDPNAHPPSLAEVRKELRLQVIAAPVTNTPYIDPLRFVSVWERTDQGVDASMPVGAPILAPGTIKVLAIIPDWYAGQPLVYFELLNGQYAGQVQYVAEQITKIAPPGSILSQGQPVAKFARSGTGIEYGWSTLNGVTLARATSGYEEGQVTPAGVNMRNWLNSLGANAGPSK